MLRLWQSFKLKFKKSGGFKNPLNYLLFACFWMLLNALVKEQGWARKKSLKGKHVYLTGAGSGLGRRMAMQFALLGAKLSICDIN